MASILRCHNLCACFYSTSEIPKRGVRSKVVSQAQVHCIGSVTLPFLGERRPYGVTELGWVSVIHCMFYKGERNKICLSTARQQTQMKFLDSRGRCGEGEKLYETYLPHIWCKAVPGPAAPSMSARILLPGTLWYSVF